MGLSNSKSSKKNKHEVDLEEFVRAKQNAYNQYMYRLKSYDPEIHGPKYIYMLEVDAEYELNCIPPYLRRGSANINNW
jgi:hypothetical protein